MKTLTEVKANATRAEIALTAGHQIRIANRGHPGDVAEPGPEIDQPDDGAGATA